MAVGMEAVVAVTTKVTARLAAAVAAEDPARADQLLIR